MPISVRHRVSITTIMVLAVSINSHPRFKRLCHLHPDDVVARLNAEWTTVNINYRVQRTSTTVSDEERCSQAQPHNISGVKPEIIVSYFVNPGNKTQPPMASPRSTCSLLEEIYKGRQPIIPRSPSWGARPRDVRLMLWKFKDATIPTILYTDSLIQHIKVSHKMLYLRDGGYGTSINISLVE
ncbi:hypothetical protein CC86DRAFT_42175 [Ophiobolus disseminans]|uniref:Uncharacterized protein n=1 Tax=Ophiobolus disseminans TaxID=1469910 RepID=A0A6A6ZW90_9PLEO|nr:hypothetical protein CC86DRAFT_42175 [Ophiobolus disseminans]